MIRTRERVRALAPLSASSGDGSLADVIASAVFDLDATQAASYTSGTTWANLCTAPADGSAQTDYDFWFGVDGSVAANDPTFNGSAGSSSAYFSGDGGDYFNCKTMVNYLASVHRTDISKPVTFVMTFNTANTTFHYLFGIGASGVGSQGWGVRLSSGNLEIFARGDSANISETIKASVSVSAATNTVLIVSFDTQAGVGKYWINSATSASWTPSATAFTSASDTNEFAIMAGIANGSPMPNGAKVYSFAAFNELFDNTKAAAIIAALEARHGRDYTP